MKIVLKHSSKDPSQSTQVTIEDILEQLDNCSDITECLKDVVKNSISELTALISKNKEDISSNAENISKDYIAIDLKFHEVESTITQINDAPIGTVTAWLGGKTFPLPKGWQKCDGSPILDGPLKGQNTPNLNGEGRFLRGGSVTDSWTAQGDMVQDHYHRVSDNGHTHRDNGHTHRDSGHTHTDSGHKHEDLGHKHVYLSTNWHKTRAGTTDWGTNRDQQIPYEKPKHFTAESQGTWT